MLNYKKLMALKPTSYGVYVNSLGQTIDFLEHPLKGDEAEVICACHELELADYSSFFETDDMIQDHREYEPTFVEGKLLIGAYEN